MPHPPEQPPQNGATNANSESAKPAENRSEAPEWFTRWADGFQKSVDARFEGMSQKNQKRFDELRAGGNDKPKAEAPEKAAKSSEEKPAASGPDINEIIKQATVGIELGMALKALGEDVRKDVESFKEQHGEAAALDLVRRLDSGKSASSANGEDQKGAGPDTGDSATQTPPTGQRFSSYEEWRKFKTADANKAADYRRANPGFDPFKLSGAPRKNWSLG